MLSRLPNLAWGAGLAVSSFVFLQQVVDPRYLYQSSMPLFYWGDTFLKQSAAKPGGLVDFAGRFLEQIYMLASAGPALMALLILAIWFLGGWLLKSRPASRGTFPIRAALIQALPPCVLLVLSIAFDHSWMHTTLQVILAMTFALLFARANRWPTMASIAVFCFAAAALNYIAGPFAGLLFAALASLPESPSASRMRGLAMLGLGIGITAAVLLQYHLGLTNLLPATGVPRYTVITLVIALMLVALGPGCWWRSQVQSDASSAAQPSRKQSSSSARSVWLPGLTQWVVLSIAIVCGCLLINKSQRAKAAVGYHTVHQEWDSVLTAARDVNYHDWQVRLDVNRALFHKGRLLEDLLNHPRIKDEGIVPDNHNESMQAPEELAQTLFDLGQVNLAEHWATEAFEMMGEYPNLLQLLAKINVLKGRPAAAKPYAQFLGQNPFYRAWADDFLRRLKQDPRMDSDPEIARIRSLNVTTDYPTLIPPTVIFLKQLLHTNPKNRMAFEYLMAHCILNGKTENILQSLDQFDPSQPLPRLIGELVLDAELSREHASPTVHKGLEETRRRLDEFRRAFSLCRNDADSGQSVLAGTFGNTYWYFSIFGATGQAVRNSGN